MKCDHALVDKAQSREYNVIMLNVVSAFGNLIISQVCKCVPIIKLNPKAGRWVAGY
jgi:hypothetical protein